ncbi:MAG TPA: hemerythrin domain-containing protein [Planctomycetota bacterium]|nr:hemerythrin domain-containing protein [Planctomycetota bacterium]
MSPAPPDPGLAQLMLGLHDELEQHFFLHQRGLLDRDFVRAARHLAHYRDHLLLHMRDEEALVLPRYAAAGGDDTDAPVRLFLGEHRKMREFTADFARRVQQLQERPDDRALLELFDREATYKNLVLHHDLRERNALYPFLGARLSPAEQQQILTGLLWAGS